jgi:hypothetical protein
MAVLNEGFVWESAPESDRKAFLGGRAEKRLLPSGTRLYKYTQYAMVHPTRGTVTPWWSSIKPLHPSDPGYEKNEQYAQNLNVSGKDYTRARWAVTKQWNSLEKVLHAELLLPVYGFAGRVSAQPLDQDDKARKVLLIGGAWQLWIPNLTAAHIHQISFA